MTKKIILLLVEGPTDEDTLALIFSLLIKEYNIEFVVIHTDITASEDITVKYIERAIENEISKYLKRNPFIRKKDIDFCVKGSYEDTWKYIMENGNSLKSNSNIAVFFDRLGIVV